MKIKKFTFDVVMLLKDWYVIDAKMCKMFDTAWTQLCSEADVEAKKWQDYAALE